MTPERAKRIAKFLGIGTLVLAWSAAVIEYSRTGEIRWSLIAAGLVFAVLPFVTAGAKTRPGP
jgi:hypothetical protein